MIHSRFFKNLIFVSSLATVYFVAGKLGLMLAFVNANATGVWPPTGIAFAAFLLLGYRLWPGVLLGAFLVNITTGGTVATSAGIAMGNTLEGLLGAYLINRFAGGCKAFNRAQDVFNFTLLAGIACTVSATFGVTSLSLGGFAPWANYESVWLTWWLGDMVGALIVAPLLVLWGTNPHVRWNRTHSFEAGILMLGLVFVGRTVFSETFLSEFKHYPLEFICIPFLIWTAFRFSQREAATAIFVLSGIAILGTVEGFGPFMREAQNETLLLLQAFMGTIAVTILSLAAVVSERKLLEISERRRIEQKLSTSEDRLRSIIESEPECVKIISPDGIVLQMNAAGLAMCEAETPEEVIGKPVYPLIAPAYLDQVNALFESVCNGMRGILEFEIIGLKGTHRWMETHAVPFRGDHNEIIGTLSVTRDMTERKKAEKALRKSEGRFAGILDIAYEAIISIDEKQKIILFNKRAEQIFGYLHEEVVGQSLDLLLPKIFQAVHKKHVADFASSTVTARQMGERGEIYGRRKNGEEFPAEASISRLDLGDEKIYTVVLRDITYQKRWEETLHKQAIHDALTGLYNRQYFNYRIEEEITRANRNQHMLAILLCDLDHFKTINDTRGHQAGDEVLMGVAHSIQESTRGADLVFRWGGDEIVVILSKTTREGILIASERIRAGILKMSEAAQLNLDVSIGVALYPENGRNADELICLADRALYIAKKGGGKVHIGEEEYRLNEHSIKAVFQPVMDVASSQVIGYEALTRDPQGKLSVFELFKKYGAIGQINELKQLCFKTQMKVAQEVRLTRLFINVDFDLISRLEPMSKPPGMEVVLEISELEALHDIENHLKIAKKWRGKGYQFAIDDFGAGFISLPFIASLVPEYIKMDRSTMLHAVSSEKFREFLEPLLQSLKTYAKEGIIAEGVETENELTVVKGMGIHLVQGFLFGKPKKLN